MTARSTARTPSLGCFGIFCLFVQALSTVALLALLHWLQPAWLDRVSFWRGARLPADPVSWSGGAAEAEGADETAALAHLAPEPDELETFEAGAVSAAYDPASGVSLAAPDGARLDFPPGSLREPNELRLAPVTWLPRSMAGPVAGPVYELRIGENEHYAFDRPVPVRLPYREELFREADPVVGVFEEGGWRPLPTRVDRAGRTASAELPHASVLGVLGMTIPAPVAGALVGGAALAAAGYVVSANEREMLWQGVYMGSGCSDVKETARFVIHSCPSGEHAPEPGLVDELAETLEKCVGRLDSVGTPVPAPSLRKYHVFIGGTRAYGDTAPGGPLFFNANLRSLLARDELRPATAIRSVVAHELVHVAQSGFFGTIAAHRHTWWLEMSAAYLGDLFWDLQDQPTDMVPERYVRAAQGRLAATPMELTDDPEHYAYGTFLRWLDGQKPGAGLALSRVVNAGADGSLTALDGAGRQAAGEGLPALFTRWAQAFHHDDLWSGKLAPRLHRGKTPLSAALAQTNEANAAEFAPVVQVRGGRTVLNSWAMSGAGRLKHLSAVAFAMDVGPLARKGKLVLRWEALGGSGPVEMWLASGTLGGVLPGKGSRGAFAKVEGSSAVVEGLRNPDGVDRVTLLAVNPLLTEDTGGVSVERWLLLAPEQVRYERDPDSPGAWTVKWERAELRDHPQAFRSYNLYRRKASDPPDAWQKVQEGVAEEVCTDRPGTDEEYVYTVKTVDQLGNESEYAESDSDDPFSGDWSGELRLVEGDFAGPIVRALRSSWSKDGKIDAGDEEQLRKIAALLDQLQQIARLGVPTDFTVRPRSGGYVLTVTSFAFMNVKGESTPLKRLGPNTLGPEKWEGPGPPPLLRRTRENEIREDGYSREEQIDRESIRYTLAWRFERAAR